MLIYHIWGNYAGKARKNWPRMRGCLADEWKKYGKTKELRDRVQRLGSVGGSGNEETVVELIVEFGIHQNLVNK